MSKYAVQSSISRLKAALVTLDLQLDEEIAKHQTQVAMTPVITEINQLVVPNIVEQLTTQPSSQKTKTAIVIQEGEIESDDEKQRMLVTEDKEADNSTTRNNILNPLTVFSVLLFLVGTGSLGAVLMTKFMKSQTPVTVVEAPNQETSTQTDLNLESIVTIETDANETTEEPVTDSPQESSESTDLAAVLLPLSVRDKPTTANNNNKPTSKISSNYYYVIAEYKGEQSLKQAKSLVPDAYLINLADKAGLSIMMGAYDRTTEAEAFVKELEQKNFTATVYHP